MFDDESVHSTGKLEVKYRLPNSNMDNLSPQEVDDRMKKGMTYEFSHTLELQIVVK